MIASVILCLLALILLPSPSRAQGAPLLPIEQQSILDHAMALVAGNYVYPERAKLIEATLQDNARAGVYRPLVRLDDFLEAVNGDMQRVSGDKHLRIVRNPRIVAQLRRDSEDAGALSPEYVTMLRESNYRLRKAECLDGNVGYFKFDNFVELRFVEDAFVGAMNFLHSASALIIDLTDNGGGASETADFLISYFLPEGTKIGRYWERTSNTTNTTIVTRAPSVTPSLETPLYVLVSERTASAAEGVAYTLQQAKRAVIVGTRTKGMANPGVQLPIDDSLFVIVPTILQTNAISGTNWEGVGVDPDVTAPSVKALDAALALALRHLAEQKDDPKERYRLRFLAESHASRLSPESPPEDFVAACVGEYGSTMRIERRQDELYFDNGEIARKLTYMSDYTFSVEGRADYRLRLPFDGHAVMRCDVLWFDDTSDTNARTK